MADNNNKVHFFADKRLSITREAELLQSFVGVTAEDEFHEEAIQKDEVQEKKEAVEGQQIGEKSTEQIAQDLKKSKGKRRKKRSGGPKPEELYCDKDRAAAVNMGSKDIKQSLKLKRKEDRSKMLQIPEEAEPGTFLALGNYEMIKGELKIALDFISKALELNPLEKHALVARSKCYILMGEPAEALRDAESALSIDKHLLKAIYQKAEALYYLGDFEHSLMYFHRGLHLRPDHEAFTLGVHKARKAIENALGSSFSGMKVTVQEKTGTIADRTPPGRSPSTLSVLSVTRQASSVAPSSLRTNSAARSRSGRKSRLLRELAPDKEYLDSLASHPDIQCGYNENDKDIQKCVKQTVDYLNARQEFWRQQLPPNLK